MAKNKPLKILPTDRWDAALLHIVQDMNGAPLNIHKLLANHPPLLEAWWQFRNYVVGGSSLSHRNTELVILRTAVHKACWYEWASHFLRGLAADLTIEQINDVTGGPGSPLLSDDDSLILTVVDELEYHGMVTPDTRETYCRRFSEQQLLDLVAVRGAYGMLSDMLATWEVPVDEHVLAAIPEGTSEASFEEQLGDFD